MRKSTGRRPWWNWSIICLVSISKSFDFFFFLIMSSDLPAFVFFFLYYIVSSLQQARFSYIFSTLIKTRERKSSNSVKYITLYKYECDVRYDIFVDFERNWENPLFSATIWRRVWLMGSIKDVLFNVIIRKEYFFRNANILH
jgi:hypothetical protein